VSFGVSGRAASGDALPTLYYTPGVPDLDAQFYTHLLIAQFLSTFFCLLGLSSSTYGT